MRQDIVDVLKTSHLDLVRALIGLPPYAVHLWHSAYIKIMAGFAFRCVHVCMFILYLIFVKGVRLH